MDLAYSPGRRTAVVLTGSGTAGAYHAGVLRALREAGVKIDVVAGRGIGAAGALFAAIDGGPRLWQDDGFWRSPSLASAYAWRPGLRVLFWLAGAALIVLLAPVLALAAVFLLYLAGLGLTLLGLDSSGALLVAGYTAAVSMLLAPSAIPTIVPRLAALVLLVILATGASATVVSLVRARRRGRGPVWWQVIGAPLSAVSVRARLTSALWQLIRGAAPIAEPPLPELGRRFADLLAENLGQPGFREVLLTVHDLDARRDLVFALLAEPYRSSFFGRRGLDAAVRAAELIDLAGVGRDHAVDALAGALALPLGVEPHQITFPPEGFWRGETHRLCDRPDAAVRLLEEVVAAGVQQVVIVTAHPPAGGPHQLTGMRRDLRGRAGEALDGFETAALRDAVPPVALRLSGIFEIRPSHNPLGPLDFGGVHDERSDRRHTVQELLERGYEDAYRQFIEPIVGASGEALQRPAVSGKI